MKKANRNQPQEERGLILKTCTLVDATFVQATRRPPSRRAGTTGDPDARFTVKRGQPHYG
jgi:hypothetical protein